MNAASFRTRARHYWRKEIRPLLLLALVVFALRSSLADWNDVPTGSMKPTIVEGDRVFVNKLAYDLKVPFTTWHLATWGEPQRGDIVVFYSPYDGTRLVKRVIGLPGDTVQLRQDTVSINGKPVEYESLPESRLRDVGLVERINTSYATELLPGQPHAVAFSAALPARREFGPYIVPAGSYFMMGDNRDNSFDSRYYGPVARNRILGRATGIALSLDRENYWLPRWHRFFRSLRG